MIIQGPWSVLETITLLVMAFSFVGFLVPDKNVYFQERNLYVQETNMYAIKGKLDEHSSTTPFLSYKRIRARCNFLRANDTPKVATQQMSGAHVYRCTETGDQYVWSVLRVGPFTTYGQETVQYALNNAFEGSASEAYISASYGSMVDLNGESVGSPLIHLHHHDLMVGKFPHEFEFFITKGAERTCYSKDGGEDCLFVHFPAGVGQALPPAGLAVSSMYNDIQQYTAKNLTVWSEYAICIRQSVQREVLHTSIWGPAVFGKSVRALMHQHPIWPVEGAVPVFRSASLAWWVSAPFDVAGTVLHTHIHSHRQSEEKVILWLASPEKLGLNKEPFILRKPWDPIRLNSSSNFIDHLRAQLPGSPRCESTKSGFEIIDGKYTDREHGLTCSASWAVMKGDIVTAVCIARVPAFWEGIEWTGQHCTIHFDIITAKGSRTRHPISATRVGTPMPSRSIPFRDIIGHDHLFISRNGTIPPSWS